MKKPFKYFLVAILTFVTIYCSSWVLGVLKQEANINFQFIQYFYTISFFYVAMGFALGLETFFRERRKLGKWKVNIWKLVFFGLPTLFFTLSNFPPFIYIQSIYHITRVIAKSGFFMSISEIVLGYVLITSFFKVD